MVAALVQTVSNPFQAPGGDGTATYGSPTTPGNLLICGMAQRDGSLSSLVVPTGFTESSQVVKGAGQWSSSIAYKEADGTETTLTWQSLGGRKCTWIAEYSGVNTTPVDAQRRINGAPKTQWFTSPDLTLPLDGLLVLWGANDDNTSAGRTAIQGYTTIDAAFLCENSAGPGMVGFHGIITGSAGPTAWPCSAQLTAGGPDNISCCGLAFEEGGTPPIPNGGIISVVS